MAESPISRLNNDLFLAVFTLLAVAKRESFRDVLSISHVCSHWRILSVSHCPELWRRFALMIRKDGKLCNKEITDQLITRCQGCTLDVGWENEDLTTLPDTTLSILEYTHRMRVYDLILPDNKADEGQIIRTLEHCKAPHMEHLALFSSGARFPSTVFGGELPSLTSLYLIQSWVDLSQLKLPKLKAFLGRFDLPNGSPATFHGWLRVLSNLPHLISFDLASIVYPYHPSDELPFPISLNRLRVINMVIAFEDLEIFIDNVSLPAWRKLYIETGVSETNAYPERLAQLFERYATPSAQGSRMSITSNGTTGICGFSPVKDYSDDEIDSNKVDDKFSISVTFIAEGLSGFSVSPEAHLAAILGAWSPEVVEVVNTVCIPQEPHYPKPIKSLLEATKSLTTLICPRRSIRRLLREGFFHTHESGEITCDHRPGLKIIPRDSRI